MSVKFCLALLALSSLTAASDPDCDELLKPLEDRNRVYGKWIFHAGTSDNAELLKELKTISSSWIDISPMSGSDDYTLRWGDKMGGKCHHGSVNSSFTGNSTKVTFHFNSTTHEHVGKHLKSCSDCILWIDSSVTQGTNGETREGRNLYLFTRTGEMDASNLEVFKKQAGCLKFESELHFRETTDLCPDTTDANEEEQ
ncbi:uncharacterized protein LOC143320456 [Chaetodon auriga]|uniref:uncharacterized protein LOC143320456 n=1 Tax=Chaetodon auriga TaxID=39042 RepID=UPI004032E6DB